MFPQTQANAVSTTSRAVTVALHLLLVAVFAAGAAHAHAQASAVYIDDTGKVGIGNTAPAAPLDVTGNAVISGQVRIGGAPDPASNRPLDVAGPGGIRIGQTAPQSDQNEIFFQDNGQIRSFDNNHRIIFDRSSAALELRELGNIILSAGATAGQRTQKVIVTGAGMNVNGDMTVTGGATVNGAATIAGALTLNGSVSQTVQYQIDDNALTTFFKPMQRYHMSLTYRNYAGRTKTIPTDILIALCGKPDGCQVRLGMKGWENATQTETASRSFVFYYSPANGRWRTSEDKVGVVGNRTIEHASDMGNWHACYFTDGTYVAGGSAADNGTGMQLLVYTGGYPNATRTCELTLIP
jgi:hypothetical protein